MLWRPPGSTRTDTLFPDTALCRPGAADRHADVMLRREVVDAGLQLPRQAAVIAAAAGAHGGVARGFQRVADFSPGDEAGTALAQRPFGGDARVDGNVVLTRGGAQALDRKSTRLNSSH